MQFEKEFVIIFGVKCDAITGEAVIDSKKQSDYSRKPWGTQTVRQAS